jgi:hypothetical protein
LTGILLSSSRIDALDKKLLITASRVVILDEFPA